MPMNARSEQALATVSPTLANLVRAAATQLQEHGTYLLVVSGLRTAAQQDALYAQGRTAPGHVVTNARAGYSMHNYGLAVDVVPYISGPSGDVNWNQSTPQFQAMVQALTKQGLVWGGSWHSLPDYDHFQMSGLPVTPTDAMRADYAKGEGNTACLSSIWTCCASGKYSA